MKTYGLITVLGVLCMTATFSTAGNVYFGTTKSDGIYVADFDTNTGTLSTPKLAVKTDGCGFITIHPNKKYLYSTGASAFKINDDGSLTHLNTQQTDGGGACHVSMDNTGRMVMTAYYGGGAIAAFGVQNDGSLSEVQSFFRHEGKGEHPQRQKKAYAHSIFPNPENTYAYAADLGIDKIMIYKMNPEAGSLEPAGEAVVPGGSMGPRHMKWSTDGKTLYVLNELDLSISIYESNGKDGSLKFIETASTLPEGADKTRMTCAEIRIHPDGRFVYASNRDLEETGRDSITVFSNVENGFKRLQTVPAHVWVPRNFNLDPSGQWMLVAGQKSENIAIFKIDPESGIPQFTGKHVAFDGQPICIEFLD